MPTPTSPERPPDQTRSVADALAAVGSGTITDRDVARLSDLTRDDARAVAASWPSLPLDVRIGVVRRAVELAKEHVHYQFGRLLRNALSDESPVVRQYAIGGLWEDEGNDVLPTLLERLRGDSSPDVRAEAADGLSRFAERAAAEELQGAAPSELYDALLRAASDEEAVIVRRRAIECIASFGGSQEVDEIIRAAYDDPDSAMQASALFAMGRTLDRRWLPVILDGFASPDAELRHESARASGQMGDPDAVPGLANLARDRDTDVRRAAIQALGLIGGRGALRTLQELLAAATAGDRSLIEAAIEDASIVVDPLRSRP